MIAPGRPGRRDEPLTGSRLCISISAGSAGSPWNTGLRSPRRSRLRPGWGEALGGRKQCSQVSEIGDGDLLPQAPCTGGQIAGFVVHTQGLPLSQTSCKCTRNQCARKANCVFPGGLPPAKRIGIPGNGNPGISSANGSRCSPKKHRTFIGNHQIPTRVIILRPRRPSRKLRVGELRK